MTYLLAGIIGLLSGITSGLFGVGGGIVMVPAMVLFLSPPIRDIKQAIGTSLAVIIPTALMGSYKHFLQGNVEWRTALALALFAVPGGYLGAWLTTQISADNLKRVFGGFIVLVGLRLLLFK
ncbi:MAG: sulfite exporter TauE/SafE family protein [Verrucomicrobia bacterium]|nr:sulfite exporter TauE/SafE family protein [Verrucomicrobiota bacterium]